MCHYARYVCGIAGRVGYGAGDPKTIRQMTETLWHRGPDEDGFFVDAGIELGMRRLAIVDVAHGQQPATNESSDVHVILNGEIYNFKELRSRLASLGHEFESHSDTEVVAHAYEQWGESCLSNLQGMFAVAIWDARSQKLMLARDRIGKKPLMYALTDDGGLIFASEARAILQAGWQRAPNFESLNHILTFGYVPNGSSAYEGIRSLPPAHALFWRNGETTIHRYWHLDWREPEPIDPKDAIDGTQAIVREAVKRRLVSERPLGVFLSGGVDSTVVAAMASELQTGTVSTYTISFSDSRFDEATYAARVAQYLGTEHHTINVYPDPHLVGDRLPKVFDQPFADSSSLPTYLLAQFASEHIVVALGGDGGDEAFTGYDRYLAAPRLQRWNTALGVMSPLAGPVARVASATGDRRLHRVARALHGFPSLQERYCALMTLVPLHLRHHLWSPDVVGASVLNRPEITFGETWRSVPASADIDRTVAVDIATYLPGDLLVKADISTMANSLELRSPLLDTQVLEFTSRIPWEVRVHRGISKYLLKQVAHRYVPSSYVERPKMGFGIPRARWLRGELEELSRDTLTGTRIRQRGWFNDKTVTSLLEEHSQGIDRDSMLWPLLMIELWAQAWID